MDGSEYARLLYLVLLGGAVTIYFVIDNRGRLGKVAQQGVVWGLLFIGVVAAYGLWDDISRDVSGRENVLSDGRIEVPKAPDGHYYVAAEVNGARVRFVVDTGASDIVLTARDAAKAGLDPTQLAYTQRAQTANGTVETAPVSLDTFSVSGFMDRGLPAVVNAGDLDTSLLGMSYLSLYHITLTGDVMTLAR